jgi:hypothetical protein
LGKGQIFTSDFIISVFIFLTVFITANLLWVDLASQIKTDAEKTEMQTLSLTVSDILVKTPGVPTNWTTANVISLGLASDENILNKTKILDFLAINYNRTRELLAMPGYNLYIVMKYRNGTIVELDGQLVAHGANISSAAMNIVKSQRVVVVRELQSPIVNFNVMVWK